MPNPRKEPADVLQALSFTSRSVETGDGWVLRVLVLNTAGDPHTEQVPPTVTVTEPGGTTDTPTMESTTCAGVYRATYYPVLPGRYTATVEHTDHGQVSFVAHVSDVVGNDDMPDIADVDDYIGDHSYSDEQVQQALDQETAAQFKVCRVPATYPADLAGALLRRVQRALAMRHLALAVKESVEGESQMVLPGQDPEVRRLERPWRKVVIG